MVTAHLWLDERWVAWKLISLLVIVWVPLALGLPPAVGAALPSQNERPRQPAFPGAEGYGRFALGGRGGRLLEVTNLADSGPGTLRATVEAEGPRTVVFNVSGLITLESKLIIRKTNSNLTIAVQTAPGKGICIRKFNFGMLGASNVILRYLRVRAGVGFNY